MALLVSVLARGKALLSNGVSVINKSISTILSKGMNTSSLIESGLGSPSKERMSHGAHGHAARRKMMYSKITSMLLNVVLAFLVVAVVGDPDGTHRSKGTSELISSPVPRSLRSTRVRQDGALMSWRPAS